MIGEQQQAFRVVVQSALSDEKRMERCVISRQEEKTSALPGAQGDAKRRSLVSIHPRASARYEKRSPPRIGSRNANRTLCAFLGAIHTSKWPPAQAPWN